MQTELIEESRRQAQICNACRYCEGYCSVFPAMHRERSFSVEDLTHLANLCHNCRGCYYACQYTAPHEFDLNLPQALANLRHDSWKANAWPAGIARLFDHNGVAMASLLTLAISLLFWTIQTLPPSDGAGFYSHMSHGTMVAIFAPAFFLPLLAMVFSLWNYWKSTGAERLHWSEISGALASAGRMKNLEGGHGDGCNFEDEDRFTQARRHFHQSTLWGFLLCLASTTSGTLFHYGFGLKAPYSLFSLPKLLGIPGGIILSLGTAGLAWLKTRADPKLGASGIWGGEMAFTLLLFFVSATGLALFAATGTSAVKELLTLHLAAVLTFFLLIPYSKMAHGFYRLVALASEEAKQHKSSD
jgi:citrate/tricarballylate utilization protein